ncbi:hypothetical protein BP6252_01531 [Coleophoma cylindrospora]|uniref:Uncharacterized protein n=1 Tax=Coleophoma cylindrospora TaxID=1849047 RepID=A0A3D8ST46_9HELO|nr:hypothetical protein BP6252_01531 [Coleophoma cylindrospora]
MAEQGPGCSASVGAVVPRPGYRSSMHRIPRKSFRSNEGWVIALNSQSLRTIERAVILGRPDLRKKWRPSAHPRTIDRSDGDEQASTPFVLDKIRRRKKENTRRGGLSDVPDRRGALVRGWDGRPWAEEGVAWWMLVPVRTYLQRVWGTETLRTARPGRGVLDWRTCSWILSKAAKGHQVLRVPVAGSMSATRFSCIHVNGPSINHAL